MADSERRPSEADRGATDDQHRAGKVGTEDIPRQLSGSTAELLAEPGLDGRFRRAWRAQKLSHWRAQPPAGFTNPRPAPIGGPQWMPPSLVCDSAELGPALDDVAELVARQRGRGAA